MLSNKVFIWGGETGRASVCLGRWWVTASALLNSRVAKNKTIWKYSQAQWVKVYLTLETAIRNLFIYIGRFLFCFCFFYTVIAAQNIYKLAINIHLLSKKKQSDFIPFFSCPMWLTLLLISEGQNPIKAQAGTFHPPVCTDWYIISYYRILKGQIQRLEEKMCLKRLWNKLWFWLAIGNANFKIHFIFLSHDW